MAYTQETNNIKEPEKRIVSTKQVNCGGKTVECNDNSTEECCKQDVGISGAVNLTVNVGSNNADHYVNDMPYNYNVESPVIQPHVIQPHVITPINQNPYVIEPTMVNPTMVQPMVQQPVVYENNFDITRNYEGQIIQDDKGNYYLLPEEYEVPITPNNPIVPKQTNGVNQTNGVKQTNSAKQPSKFNIMELLGLKKSDSPCKETFYPEFI